MTEQLTKQFADALDLVSKAKDAMINAIISAVKESDNNEVEYVEICSNYRKSYTENRTIKYNEESNLCMFDDYDNELCLIKDLTANDLYDICLNIK
jgi:hypothetical protein